MCHPACSCNGQHHGCQMPSTDVVCVCREASRDNFKMSDLKLKEFEARLRREKQTFSFHIFGPTVQCV